MSADRCPRCFPGKPGRELIDCDGSAGFRDCTGCAAPPSPATVVQPMPAVGSAPQTVDLVIEDIKARARLGVAKYKEPHRHDNGRDHLVDAYQEQLDGAIYLRAEIGRRSALEARCLAADAARDEATRRLAVVEEAVRQAVTDLNFAAATRSIMLVDRAIDDLNAVIHTEKQP